jgi:hypothetical protein
MQVMPATAAQPGYGIPPAANDTPAEYNRVGNALLDKLQAKYGGDMTKAWAAYNWGPARVNRAVAANGDNWLASAPKSVQKYVNKNMRALGNSPPQASGVQVADNAPLQPPEAQAAPDNQWGLRPHDFSATGQPPVRYLNADEKKAAGYPADAIVQRNAKGADNVLEKGTTEGSTLTPDAVDAMATTYLKTGKMPALGLGNATVRNQIINRSAAMLSQHGMSDDDLPYMQAAYGADVKARTTRAQQLSYMNQATNTAIAHGREALNLAAQIPAQTNLKLWNLLAQGVLDQNSNPKLYAMQAAAKQAEAEVAKVITGNPSSGAGQLTDEARKEFRIIEGPAGVKAKQEAWATIVRMMKEKTASVTQEMQGIDLRIHGGLDAYSSKKSNPAAPQPGAVVRGFRFKGGNPADKNNWIKV